MPPGVASVRSCSTQQRRAKDLAAVQQLEFKQMGIGLALAVLIDATIIRAILLPATMKLLGDRNWYLPKWLDWLPHAEHEPPAPVVAATLGVPLRTRPRERAGR
jgi:MMPL family